MIVNLLFHLGSQMCTSTAFILETGKELDGAYEKDLISAPDFNYCSRQCLESIDNRGFLCRSFMYDDAGRTCILYDEDPLAFSDLASDPMQNQVVRPLKSSPGNLYRVLCVNTDRGKFSLSNLSPIHKSHVIALLTAHLNPSSGKNRDERTLK